MRWTIALLAIVLSGCAGTGPAQDPDQAPPEPPQTPTHAAVGTVEPADLIAPTFHLLGAVAAGGPAYGAGEPSIWADLQGRIVLAFPGCDRGFYLVSLPTDDETCGNGLVYLSDDEGASWQRLNRDGDGRYTDEGPAANNDADVAVDAAGVIWASNLGGGGIQIHRYDGAWQYVANIVPPTAATGDPPDTREGADRQWIAAAGPGHLINTWMRTSPSRDIAINSTFDGGATWTGTTYYGDGIGWLGTVQFAADGKRAYIPYTQPLGGGVEPLFGGGQQCAMHVIRTADGGMTWEDVDTGARWETSVSGTHWSCVQMAPALDVTGDGTVVVAWAQDEFLPESTFPYTATSASTILYYIASSDNGTSWSEPQWVTPTLVPEPAPPLGNSIMPWVTGGAGDRFALTYLHNPVPTDGDYTAAVWDVRVAVFDGPGADPVGALIEANVHAGPICTRGGTCLLTGSDRAFLDFFEADVMPDGRLVVTYPHDLNPTKMIEIRVAIQDGGSPLLVRA